ncbi:MAG: hypothetical protein LPK14_14700, partial [Hymenobacteraceae bacterium]|nr:hypothetical protein [Hymenobacteraceae bacterium]
GATLQDVMAMGDATAGTVFTIQEVENGLEKLISVGYVGISKNKLYLTPAFLREHEIASEQGSFSSSTELYEALLGTRQISQQKIDEVRAEVMKNYKLKSYYHQYMEQNGG